MTYVDAGYLFAPGVTEGLGWSVQAGFELPLFHTNGGAIRAAEATSKAEVGSLGAETERLSREVKTRLREARLSGSLVSELQQRARPALRSAELETARLLAGGSIDVIRALLLEERRLALEVRLLRAVRRNRLALAQLRRVVGGPLPVR